MSETTWRLSGGAISLETDQGILVSLSAIEIFQIVFGRAKSVRGHAIGVQLAKAMPQLSFSRFAAPAAVRISGSGGKVFVESGVQTEFGFISLLPEADQVIAGDRWYPVKAGSVEIAQEWAKSLGATEGNELTIGTLIAMRAAANRPVDLLDHVTLSSAAIASDYAGLGPSVEGLVATLYPYQTEGIGFLRFVAEQGVGCILADEMGLGKTLQIIALMQIEKNAGRHPALVVAPATLLENWRRELSQFAPTLSVHVHAGNQRPGIATKLAAFDVTIVSYETAVRDEPLLASIQWNIVALDEAQNIKNPHAQRTAAVKNIPRRVSVAVSGTPVENRLDDLWSVADFALPGLLGELQVFRSEFADAVSDASRLAPIVAPILLRRRVSDVARDLPEKIEIPQPLTMSRTLAEGYEALRKETLAEYGPSGGLVATVRLRSYCAHPLLSGAADIDPAVDMPKYVRMLEILEEVFSAGEKALVFSSYQGMVDILMADLPRRFGNGYFRYIDGRVEVADRQPTVDGLFEHAGYGALFLNPKAAGTGLNITAANHVIHYNPEWNPALTDQASGRAYRRKQQRPVTIHHLFFADTVEEVIMDRARFKRELASEAVTSHEGDTDPLRIARALQISPFSRLQGFEQ
jgi:SNF2 family DNA or RNA helicase